MTEPDDRLEQYVIAGGMVFAVAVILWLTVFTSGPAAYSFNEFKRAKVVCGNDSSDKCQISALKGWRKSHPNEPRGSKP